MNTYITNSNSKKIIYNMDLRSIDIAEEIYKIDFKWFNTSERKQLLAFKLLFSRPEEFFKKYKRIETPIDNKNLVFEGTAPAYHFNTFCERLNSDYQNFIIPEEIKNQGNTKIQEFRDWVKENMHLVDHALDLFLDRMKWKFGLEEKLKGFHFRNSGVSHQQNLDLETLESRINNLIQESVDFYSRDEKNKYVIDNYIQNPQSNNRNNSPLLFIESHEVQQILKDFEQKYKHPLKDYLKEYYKVKYNPALEFKGELIEQLGFKPCQKCTSKHIPAFPKNNIPEKQEIKSSPKITQEQILIRVERYPIIVEKIRNCLMTDPDRKANRQTAVIRQIIRIYYPSGKTEDCVRKAFIDVPLEKTKEQVETKLNSFPNACIYQVLSDKPILSDIQIQAVQTGLLNIDDIAFGIPDIHGNRTGGQVLRYGQSKSIPFEKNSLDFIPSPINNIQFKANFFSKTQKPDIDLRKTQPK